MTRFPDRGIGVNTGKPAATSAGRLFGINTIHGSDGPYMTRAWIGRLRLHIFHRGDADPDPHCHPFDFTTFPLTPYVEEVTEVIQDTTVDGRETGLPRLYRYTQVVPAWKWSFRKATHTHRVLGRYAGDSAAEQSSWSMVELIGPATRPGKIITLVWTSKPYRLWGFLKERDGKSCWVYWKDYIFGGGKSGPCQ